MMDEFEINKALKSLVILIDTREQETEEYRRRVALFECPVKRQKLDFGDYSAEVQLKGGSTFSLAGKVAIERKMSLDELAQNLTRGRERFCREFNRAKKANGKVYLLVENASYEKIALQSYRSQYAPKAFIASLAVWMARYPCIIQFCGSQVSPRVIYNLLFYEMREALKKEGNTEELIKDAEAEPRLDKTVSADD